MKFLIGLSCLTLGTLVFSSTPQLVLSRSIAVAPGTTYSQRINSQPTKSPNVRRADVSVTVKLRAYEFLGGKVVSFGDVSLILSNPTKQNVEFEVIRTEIVASDSEKVLMSATRQELKLPNAISLKPGESRALEYRVKSGARVYQKGQRVIANVHYQMNGQRAQIAQSNVQAVASLIR